LDAFFEICEQRDVQTNIDRDHNTLSTYWGKVNKAVPEWIREDGRFKPYVGQ